MMRITAQQSRHAAAPWHYAAEERRRQPHGAQEMDRSACSHSTARRAGGGAATGCGCSRRVDRGVRGGEGSANGDRTTDRSVSSCSRVSHSSPPACLLPLATRRAAAGGHGGSEAPTDSERVSERGRNDSAGRTPRLPSFRLKRRAHCSWQRATVFERGVQSFANRIALHRCLSSGSPLLGGAGQTEDPAERRAWIVSCQRIAALLSSTRGRRANLPSLPHRTGERRDSTADDGSGPSGAEE